MFGLPKVAQTKLSIMTDQAVLRFKVPVDDSLEVEVLEGAEYLSGERLNRLEFTWICRTLRLVPFSLKSSYKFVG